MVVNFKFSVGDVVDVNIPNKGVIRGVIVSAIQELGATAYRVYALDHTDTVYYVFEQDIEPVELQEDPAEYLRNYFLEEITEYLDAAGVGYKTENLKEKSWLELRLLHACLMADTEETI